MLSIIMEAEKQSLTKKRERQLIFLFLQLAKISLLILLFAGHIYLMHNFVFLARILAKNDYILFQK